MLFSATIYAFSLNSAHNPSNSLAGSASASASASSAAGDAFPVRATGGRFGSGGSRVGVAPTRPGAGATARPDSRPQPTRPPQRAPTPESGAQAPDGAQQKSPPKRQLKHLVHEPAP